MKLKQIFTRQCAAGMLLLLGLLLALSPAGQRTSLQSSPKEIALAIVSRSDHVTAEEVADWLINKRPDIQLIDVRTSEEYQQYHIPGAVNIPLAKLFDDEYLYQIDPDKIIVLYSNGGTHAAQAWVLLRQMGIESYVLLGGLNYWVQAILNPQPPDDLVADQEILLYEFRKSASQYFTGGQAQVKQTEQAKQAPRPKPKFKFKRKKKADEGC